VIVVDNQAPVLSGCPNPAGGSYQCYSQVPAAAVVTASDNCDSNVVVNFSQSESNPGSSCSNVITRTWTATDSSGNVVETVSGPRINGPWDLTAVTAGDDATLFVTNVLNGTVASGETPIDEGTVVRITLYTANNHPPAVTSEQVIASGFPERTDPAALVVGPTGVTLGMNDVLYVADTQGNRIAAVPDARFRHSPLGAPGITVAKV